MMDDDHLIFPDDHIAYIALGYDPISVQELSSDLLDRLFQQAAGDFADLEDL